MTLLAVTPTSQIKIGCCSANTHLVGEDATLLACLKAIENKSTAKAETIIAQVVMRPMAKTFCRPAAEFVQHLNTLGLSFVKNPRLSLVQQ